MKSNKSYTSVFMRSFHHLARRELTTLVVFFIVVLMAVLSLWAVDQASRTSVPELRENLSTVNAMVAAIYRMDTASPEEKADVGRQLRLAATALASAASLPETEHAQQLLDAPIEFYVAHGPEATLSELTAIAGSINGGFRAQQQRRSWILGVSFAGLSVIAGFFLFLARRTRKHYQHFLSRGNRLLDEISELLTYRRQELEFEPVWHEEHELTTRAEQIAATIREDRDIAGEWVFGNLETFVPKLQRALSRIMPCERVAVAFIESDGHVVAESASVLLPEVHLEPGFREPIERTTLGEVAALKRPRIINDLTTHYQQVHQSEGTRLLLREGIRSSLTVPLVIRGRCVGFLFVASTKQDAFTQEHTARAERLVTLLRQNIYFHYLTQQIVAATAGAFVNLMEYKDNETSLHITRMSRYSHAIARRLSNTLPEVTPTMLREILWFAPLHDTGKIGIPEAILLKPGPLTAEERATIEQHVDIGVEVISRMNRDLSRIVDQSLLQTALDIISGHHERFDGTGYPRKLRGSEIPLAGRITAIADVFDALTSRRPYKEPMSVDRAMEIISEGVGSHFDPMVFDAFQAAKQEICDIYETFKET
ncbi:MAG: HD domain-containing phosphohydrolase [Spirochaetota bacterium]